MLTLQKKHNFPWQRTPWNKSDYPKHDMVELYEKATGNTLRRSGRAWVGKCPLHEDDKPSFAIYEDTDSWYCFGCSASGNSSWLKKKLEEL